MPGEGVKLFFFSQGESATKSDKVLNCQVGVVRIFFSKGRKPFDGWIPPLLNQRVKAEIKSDLLVRKMAEA